LHSEERLGMGCCCSKKAKNLEQGDGKGDFIAKQNVTVWEYHSDGPPDGKLVAKDAKLECLADEGAWWKMKCGNTTGYAAKYYFVHKDFDEDYKKEPWYFGDMPREEAVHLLGDNANPDGSFLVRHTTRQGGMDVLSLKYYNTKDEAGGYKYMNYNVKKEGDKFYFTKKKMFAKLSELITFCMENRTEEVATKLTNICLIPNPHSDPGFEFSMLDYDSLRVPYTEIVLGKELGSGQFGKVYAATFRGNLQVAVKQLKVENEEEGAKALEEFFSELNTLKRLNHPNLVQLFAYIVDQTKGNFMIQEFMAEGDLKNYLQKWKKEPQRMKQVPKMWSKLLAWQIEVARGMERLESLNIVHRDLAARNVLLDKFGRAKVADFGLAVTPTEERQQKGEKLPVKWTSPEALFKQKFTTMSDVWAFGILMFEILTIGENPYRYSNVKNRDYKEKLKKEFEEYNKTRIKDEWGLRCKDPLLVNEYQLEIFPVLNVNKDDFKAVTKVMKSCWDIEPADRPSFREVVNQLEGMKSYYDEN